MLSVPPEVALGAGVLVGPLEVALDAGVFVGGWTVPVGVFVLVGVAVGGTGVFVGVLVGPLTPPTKIRSKSGPQLPTVGFENFRVLLPALRLTVTLTVPTVFQSPATVTGKVTVVAVPPLTLSDAVRAAVSPLMYAIVIV